VVIRSVSHEFNFKILNYIIREIEDFSDTFPEIDRNSSKAFKRVVNLNVFLKMLWKGLQV